ncbi:ABC transporter permease [Paenibacillus psychroresistens]|uniref:ABC transporter permease n=1 Tax=Paenibacillus psychroresistens TaxID=1778678 RepID=A0A6B8RGI4_9BACL|nr:ABC transporter permease [Paenibacillus psychroresistens]
MLNLLLNENMKIYRRMRTWIMMAVIVILTLTVLLIGHFEAPSLSEAVISRTLWHGISVAGANLIFLCTIFTVVIGADSVAGEFSSGTIKLLLIRPASRAKILLSKYVSMLVFAIVLILILLISAFLISGILEGFSSIADGTAGHVLAIYGTSSIEMLLIVTLAFMLSTVFRSSSLAIGMSLGLLFIGPLLVLLIAKYSWAKYYLFSNTLTQYVNHDPLIDGLTLNFSIGVLLAYFIIFNLLSWVIFIKRDVAA